MPNRVAIVGAGIGGLATAIAFARVGWSVTVLERAEALEPVGAGIVLAPNAMRALATIGVVDAILKAGHRQRSGAVRTSTGTLLQHIASAVGSDGTPTIAIHRADLVRILVDALPAGTLRLGTEVTGLRQTGSGVVVTSTGGEVEAELAVGADGIHSLVRRELFPQHPPPAFAGFTAWRAVVDAPTPGAVESWGSGRIFGAVPLSNSRTYVYATAKTSAGQRAALSAGELRARFAAWHAPIPALLESLVDADVLAHEVFWLKKPLPAFHSGRVALVGDAAHAMTPNLGQGACQAIEDAVTLAAYADGGQGLARYTAARRPRTRAIARQSSLVSTMAHLGGPLVALRNHAIRLATPVASRAAVRSARGVVDWLPPGR